MWFCMSLRSVVTRWLKVCLAAWSPWPAIQSQPWQATICMRCPFNRSTAACTHVIHLEAAPLSTRKCPFLFYSRVGSNSECDRLWRPILIGACKRRSKSHALDVKAAGRPALCPSLR
ncbi:hypothetical protein BDP55DRAFT_647991 [Colletotrichum godetiae]|uniref:Secreted protein n=1 Tax=Colletotrichum godetiae TaxID=1209918 RepID=A0AAJ0AX55_9PEZI|nr:uncharacterized protein BDP55DRAFT_647991 [Colletotrichum godetiae]KAK1690646.1 hypothetical protein BDP55DRAFT_647991 [Colletotrichum godetiae]